MDEKIIIYIILGLAYFLFNALRKKQKNDRQQDDSRNGDSRPDQGKSQSEPRRQLTFDELLKEITEGKAAQQEKPVTQYVDYDDDIGEEIQDLEDVTIDYSKTDETYEIYEKAKKQAFARPSLEESSEAEQSLKFGKFEVFEDHTGISLLERYTRELRDPEGFKKAIILSEVLNRRHF